MFPFGREVNTDSVNKKNLNESKNVLFIYWSSLNIDHLSKHLSGFSCSFIKYYILGSTDYSLDKMV